MRGLRGCGAVLAAAVALAGASLAPAARAAVSVRVAVEPATVAVGDTFGVALRADLDDPVLGWGLDLTWDSAVIALDAAPAIAVVWDLGVTSADGDGLAGGVLPVPPAGGVSGGDVLLAELVFRALAPGGSDLVLSFTPSDLTEGFALDPSGFETDVSFADGSVAVVPEPATAGLLVSGLAIFAAARRARRARRGGARRAPRLRLGSGS